MKTRVMELRLIFKLEKKMSKYFKLEEFLRSDTAIRKKIDNSPSWEVVSNLNRLANFLDELREAWAKYTTGSGGIRVSSGFRCPQLNAAVGGVQGSAHQYGNAADISPVNGRQDEFERFLKSWLRGKKYDQCLWETSKSSGGRWVHFSLFSNKGEQRCKMFGLTAA